MRKNRNNNGYFPAYDASDDSKNLAQAIQLSKAEYERTHAPSKQDKEIDFKTMQCHIVSGLFFAGEVLNIEEFLEALIFKTLGQLVDLQGQHCEEDKLIY